MKRYTPLYEQHVALGTEMFDSNGWVLPLHFGSQIEEHHQVRKDCGVFDTSFMTVVDVTGHDAKKFLQYLLTNDIGLLTDKKTTLYSLLLNEQGGIVDFVTVYSIDTGYRLVCAASLAGRNTVDWITQHKKNADVDVVVQSSKTLLSVQGPHAIQKLRGLLDSSMANALEGLQPLQSCVFNDWFISRTGYSGEDGVDIMLPTSEVKPFWLSIIGAGIMPIGMRARDTLRLEAGFNLYAQDMDEHTLPSECNMGWAVALDTDERDFIGRLSIVENQKKEHHEKLIGLVSEERSMLCAGQVVRVDGADNGAITSAHFSPTLGRCIAFARVPSSTGSRVEVEMNGKWCPMRVVTPKFVRYGKVLI